MWCVVADNNDEFWVYGLFNDKEDAQEYLEKLEKNAPSKIAYWVAEFIAAGK